MVKKIKAPAVAVSVPQSKTDCAAYIKNLGDVQREFERQRAAMNDAIAQLTKDFEPNLALLQGRAEALTQGIQTWCEANRTAICDKGGKTASLVTGEVSWRNRPPSISIRGADSVLETLQRMGLDRFVRTKSEPNKEAMLNEPDAVRGIAGITIVTGVEDFGITPFAVDVEVA